MKTLVDVARESFLILDSSLRVLAVNPIFYKNFKNHIEIVDYGQYIIWVNNDSIAWLKGIEIEVRVGWFQTLKTSGLIVTSDPLQSR